MTEVSENILYAITLSYSENGEQCNESTYIFLSDSPLFTEDAVNEAFRQLQSKVILDDGTKLNSYNISMVANQLDYRVIESLDIPVVHLFHQ